MIKYYKYFNRDEIQNSFHKSLWRDHLLEDTNYSFTWEDHNEKNFADNYPYFAGYVYMPYQNGKLWVIVDKELDIPGPGYRVFGCGTNNAGIFCHGWVGHGIAGRLVGSIDHHKFEGVMPCHGFVLRLSVDENEYHMPLVMTHLFSEETTSPVWMTVKHNG